MASTLVKRMKLSKRIFRFSVSAIIVAISTVSLEAQTGTRGSADLKNGGLILQNDFNGDLSQPPALTPPPANSFPSFPTATPATSVQVQTIAPPTIVTSNARGTTINYDQTTSVAPPVINNIVTSNGVVNPVSATEFIVRDFDGGVGDNLPIVDQAYETMDRGGVIESTSFGRPANEITTATTIAAETVVLSDGTIVSNPRGNGTTLGVASLPAASRSTQPTYVGGVKPGVRVAIPRPKGNPPRRTTSVARNTTTTAPSSQPAKSIFVQQPVQQQQPKTQPKTTITRTPTVTSSFVSGGALGLDTSNAQPLTTQQVAKVEPTTPTPAATTAPPAKPDPLKIRILFSPDSIELQEQVKPALAQLARQLKSDTDMQIQLLSFASGKDARRLSLTRALSVRANLIAQGIDSGRMIVKARGDKSDGGQKDRLDIVEIN